jgi:hypothetical protein
MKLDQRWPTSPIFHLPSQPQNNVTLMPLLKLHLCKFDSNLNVTLDQNLKVT